jgi:DNA-binding LacI/PurR family transcriptional regulator
MPTINDVARAAGVSPSTVSYVLSGRRPISAETRARVHAAIADLGFHPHAGARALASSKTNVLALVVPLRVDVNVPVIMQFATAVVTSARTHNHDVLLLTKDEGTAGLERVANSTMVDALIVMDVERDDLRIPALGKLKQPSVLIGLPTDPAGIACVDLDFAAAAGEALRHLAWHGHRRIALIGPSPAVYRRGTSYADRFLTGFTATSAELGLQTLAHPCEPGPEGVRECLADIDSALPGATALVVHNEEVLRLVLDELRAGGRRIPEHADRAHLDRHPGPRRRWPGRRDGDQAARRPAHRPGAPAVPDPGRAGQLRRPGECLDPVQEISLSHR